MLLAASHSVYLFDSAIANKRYIKCEEEIHRLRLNLLLWIGIRKIEHSRRDEGKWAVLSIFRTPLFPSRVETIPLREVS